MTQNKPLFHTLESWAAIPDRPKLSLAIGVFDGVHLGHQALIQRANEVPNTVGAGWWRSAALTFDPHPAALFAPGGAPPLLGTLEERAALLHAAGAEHVIVARFDAEFAALTAGEFIEEVLSKQLRVGEIVIGDDFRFGRDRTGDARYLYNRTPEYGYHISTVAAIEKNGVPVRSTMIRQLLAEGKAEEAAALLGRSYALSGTVVQGRQLGRTLGFPTANLASAPGVLVPGAGVYAGRVLLENGEVWRAAISVGDNPTVGPDLPRTVEAYLLDSFDRNIYGQRIVVEFTSFLRSMLKFDGLDALIVQMNRDVDEAKRRLSL